MTRVRLESARIAIVGLALLGCAANDAVEPTPSWTGMKGSARILVCDADYASCDPSQPDPALQIVVDGPASRRAGQTAVFTAAVTGASAPTLYYYWLVQQWRGGEYEPYTLFQEGPSSTFSYDMTGDISKILVQVQVGEVKDGPKLSGKSNTKVTAGPFRFGTPPESNESICSTPPNWFPFDDMRWNTSTQQYEKFGSYVRKPCSAGRIYAGSGSQ